MAHVSKKAGIHGNRQPFLKLLWHHSKYGIYIPPHTFKQDSTYTIVKEDPSSKSAFDIISNALRLQFGEHDWSHHCQAQEDSACRCRWPPEHESGLGCTWFWFKKYKHVSKYHVGSQSIANMNGGAKHSAAWFCGHIASNLAWPNVFILTCTHGTGRWSAFWQQQLLDWWIRRLCRKPPVTAACRKDRHSRTETSGWAAWRCLARN